MNMEFFENPKLDRMFDITLSILLVAVTIMTAYLVYKTIIEEKTICLESKRESISLIEENSKQEKDIEEKNIEKNTSQEIYVDIKGAVKKPGVYKIGDNSIINDVIKLAGGLKANASTKYLNLSKKVQNEMVITIFTATEISKMATPTKDTCSCPTEDIITCKDCSVVIPNNSSNDSNNTQKMPNEEQPTTKKISLNKGTKDELMTLTGVGEAKADAIIEYRTKNNGFKALEEIMNVSGIGEAAYEKIKDNITL